MTILIAGSGPAGMFAALGALQAGAKVVMIDPGLQLDPDASDLKNTLAGKPWQNWSAEEMVAYKAQKSGGGKTVFGSDFATRRDETITEKNCRIMMSEALGGLSNVWGRGVEPPYAGECDDWEFKEDFFRSVREVLAHIPFCADDDNLANIMPLYADRPMPHRITATSQRLLELWNRHSAALNRSGVHFGKSRIVARMASDDPHGCRYCGMCFYGCAYGALFDTGQMLPELSARYPQFEYRPSLRLKRFRAHSGGVEVIVEAEKKDIILQAEKLILATGAAQSTIIAMRSLGQHEAAFKNSDLIKIPFFLWGAIPPESESYHALGQLVLTVKRADISKKAVVVHIFGKNPAIEDAVLSRCPVGWRNAARKLFSPLLRRVYIGMCFLHSDDSAGIGVRDDGSRTVFFGKHRWRALGIYFRLLAFLFSKAAKTGFLPIPFIGGVSLPGNSVHYGASMPIGGSSALATDRNGQLRACPSVYVADAAALPDIPAGSYTLSIMANAHRIGKIAAA